MPNGIEELQMADLVSMRRVSVANLLPGVPAVEFLGPVMFRNMGQPTCVRTPTLPTRKLIRQNTGCNSDSGRAGPCSRARNCEGLRDFTTLILEFTV
jgi:hypothetical protein